MAAASNPSPGSIICSAASGTLILPKSIAQGYDVSPIAEMPLA